MSRFFKSAAFPILIVIVLAFFASKLISNQDQAKPASFSQFLTQLDEGQVRDVTLRTKDNSMEVTLDRADKNQYTLGYPPMYAEVLVNQLRTAQAEDKLDGFNVKPARSNVIVSLLTYILPFIIFIGFWIFLMNQVQGGGSKVMSFGKSRAKRMSVDSPKITFRDVAGVDEAVEELHEIKEFLENPKKFQALGARIPKGVLLYGPPGTGKTLLARAVAGEAGVPFFSISGSDFVEMFVGVGASRVRDLFEQAKQNSPCIIFMDEIDAVGRHRGAGMGGGHDEREQTLNQLLVEMDGFEAKDNIIMIAATNRPDILDPALLRPGRFDRQITVDRPDRKGRAKILEVHTRGKPLAKDIEIDALAGQTPGFTGADLSNLVNEAALLAARTGKKEITQTELEEGIMRVVAGPEKKTRVMGEKERLITAYHEMGHAIVGHFLEHSDPVHKISIISRGQALGYTISMPSEDKFLTTRAELNDTMAMTLGGRAAEEIVFGEITTGASNDLEKVTATAKQMVMRFGMSEKLGPRVFGHDHGQPFLGREFSSEPDYSDEIAREIDDEIRRIVEAAHQVAKDMLVEHRDSLTTISELLLKRETIESEEFVALLAGKSEEEVFGPDDIADRTSATPERPELPSRGRPRRGQARACRVPAWPAARPRPAASTCPRSPSSPSCSAPRRGRIAVPSGRVPHHGRGQRHAGLVLRRRRVPRSRRRRRPTGCGSPSRAPTCSTSAASRPAPAPTPSPSAEELARVLPVIEGIRAGNPDVRVSIDTSKAAVAAAALDAGADYVNDVTALRGDPEMAALVAERGVDVCLMHMLGTPRTMQSEARYDDVVDRRPRLPRRARRGGRRGWHRARADRGRSRHRLRQDARPQPRAAAPARASSRRSAGRSCWAPRASRSSAGSRGARRPSGSPRRSPRWSWASSAGRRSSASTTSPRHGTPSRWRLLPCAPDGRRRRGLRRRRAERRRGVRGTRGRGHHRDRRAVALHPSRRLARPSARSASGSSSTCGSTSASPTRSSRTASRTPSTTARSARSSP